MGKKGNETMMGTSQPLECAGKSLVARASSPVRSNLLPAFSWQTSAQLRHRFSPHIKMHSQTARQRPGLRQPSGAFCPRQDAARRTIHPASLVVFSEL